jgi:hypothetical protein
VTGRNDTRRGAKAPDYVCGEPSLRLDQPRWSNWRHGSFISFGWNTIDSQKGWREEDIELASVGLGHRANVDYGILQLGPKRVRFC